MEVSAAKKAGSSPHIPIEIIRCILLKLKVKAVIRCECVCKQWRSIIQDQDFKLSYGGRKRVVVVASGGDGYSSVTSITTNNTLRIKTEYFSDFHNSFPLLHGCWSNVWCSCNGLVLFSAEKHILLWDPSTRCCKKVLELECLNRLWYIGLVSGLCYVPSTGDYKVVLFFHHDGIVRVASLKNKEWRKVLFPYNSVSVRDGVNFHNTPHWWVTDYFDPECDKIVYFDPECDEFKELPTPTPTLGGGSSVIIGLGIMDDSLCMARQWEETNDMEVLVMKEYGAKNYRWISQFVISATKFKRNFRYNIPNITFYSSKCNTKVLICICYLGCSGEILVYDVKNKTLNNFLGQYKGPVKICSYVQGIVSPHEFIWRDDHLHKLPENDNLLTIILKKFNI